MDIQNHKIKRHIIISHKMRRMPREKKRKKDGKALFYIHQAMHESILPRVATTITTKQACTGMNHSVSHLKVFGCVTYAHMPDELRKKLDKKGQK